MLWLRKSKKGFTLIELMVVVAIIGILSLLGLRLYLTQQEKAKQAIVKANVGTSQTLLQSELADIAMWDSAADAVGYLNALAPGASGMKNPYDNSVNVLVDGTEVNTTLALELADLSADGAITADNIGRVLIVRNDNSVEGRPHLLLQGIGHDAAGAPAIIGEMLSVFK